MKQTINTTSQFVHAFHAISRSEQFSYNGLKALYNYLEDMDKDYELDVIELCCEWSESTIEEALACYSLDSLEELKENTIVIEIDDDNILYMNY